MACSGKDCKEVLFFKKESYGWSPRHIPNPTLIIVSSRNDARQKKYKGHCMFWDSDQINYKSSSCSFRK